MKSLLVVEPDAGAARPHPASASTPTTSRSPPSADGGEAAADARASGASIAWSLDPQLPDLTPRRLADERAERAGARATCR